MEIIIRNAVRREDGYSYHVDKDGNVTKKKEHWLFNKYFIVTILVILVSLSYWYDTKAARDMEKSLENNSCFQTCMRWNIQQDVPKLNLTIPPIFTTNLTDG